MSLCNKHLDSFKNHQSLRLLFNTLVYLPPLCVYTYSQYVVKYYGSYFKNTDLWIVMEYCGAGSVSDIMRIVNRPVSSYVDHGVSVT